MLKRIQIEQLYNLYNYDIQLHSNGDVPCFITGPNGFGKTTILNIIDAVYHSEYDKLSEIPFKQIVFDFEVDTAEGNKKSRLHIYKDSVNKISTQFSYPGTQDKELAFFLNVDDFYYIKDQRLFRKERIGGSAVPLPTISQNAVRFSEKLEAISNSLTTDLLITDLQFSGSIAEEEYNKQIAIIDKQLQPAYRYGLITKRQYPKYDSANAVFLKAYIDVLLYAIKKYSNEFSLLTTFENVINSYEFSDKRFVIHKNFGYKFISTNPLKTPLENETLSSGERQIMIQMYELLFVAEQDAFVLIDEPEISAHYAWQLLYLDNISNVARIKNMQMLVATHSPLMFNSDYKLTVDLFEQHSQNIQIQ